MSLDVYLHLPNAPRMASSGIYLRENGQTREITRAEWEARFPGREPYVWQPNDDQETTQVYWGNITHNLNDMAREAGIYEHLWRPDEIGITHAVQLIEPLRTGLLLLRRDPERFRAFNPPNGWGDYDGLVHFVANYLDACEKHPNAEVDVSR